MKVVTAVAHHAADVYGFEGVLVDAGTEVRLLPGSVVLQWYYSNPGHPRAATARAWQVGEDGRWPSNPFIGYTGSDWVLKLRGPLEERTRSLVCALCVGDAVAATGEQAEVGTKENS